MVQSYLVDTCIWRDFYEYRFSESGRHLGKYATEFFMRVLKNKDKILFSEGLIRELRKYYTEEGIYDMLNLLFRMQLLVRIEVTPEEFKEAGRLSQDRNLPFVDCLNAVQARNYCAIMVSQDRHYFDNLSDVVKTIRP